jgi:hypothetical protein
MSVSQMQDGIVATAIPILFFIIIPILFFIIIPILLFIINNSGFVL